MASYVTKVKTVLTGLAPTHAEIDAVAASPSALGTLVDDWMALPAYQSKMERLFADAFQQAQAQDWKSVIDDRNTPAWWDFLDEHLLARVNAAQPHVTRSSSHAFPGRVRL